MKSTSTNITRFFSFAVFISGLFFCSHVVFAGTLTDFSYSATTYETSAAADYTFNYTIETANPNMILYASFPNGFDLSASGATVTINGTPATVGEYWNGGSNSGGAPYIRLLDPTAPTGSVIQVIITNVVNSSVGGSYNFDWIYTADGGGNAVDTIAGGIIPPLSISAPDVPFSGTGSGTEMDPYIITTCDQLQEIKNHLDADYRLANNIDCSATSGWNANPDEWVDGVVDGELIPDPYTIVINNGYEGFEPIGNFVFPFTGTLDGNDKVISGLWIFRKNHNENGIFGAVSNATIKDVIVSGSNIVGGSFTGTLVGNFMSGLIQNVTMNTNMVRAYLTTYGGGIAGYMTDGTIENSTNNGGNVHGSGNVIGGLVGRMDGGSITDSHSSAAVDGGEYIGGVVGGMYGGTIVDTYATGNVEADSSENTFGQIVKNGRHVGGFAGFVSGQSTITGAYATGTVTGEGSNVGGFVGSMENGVSISDSYSTGAVTGYSIVGGFAGSIFINNQITDSYATGNVTSTAEYAGGFAGSSACESVFTRTYATGNVIGVDYVGGFTAADGCEGPGSTFIQSFASGNVEGHMSVGGFVGQASQSTFNDVYASGNVEGATKVGGFAGEASGGAFTNTYSRGFVTGESDIGGFIGLSNEPTINDSFWDYQTSGTLISAGGTSKNTEEMQNTTTFTDTGWDFDTIWERDENNIINSGYPYFDFRDAPEDTTAPELVVIKNVSRRVKTADAVLIFRTSDSTCEINAEAISSNRTEMVEFHIDPLPLVYDTDTRAYMTGIKTGGTYSVNFRCIDPSNNESNTITMGPFTVISGSSTGGYAPTTSNTTPTTQNISTKMCSTDQLLTQNLKAPSRNGKYNNYTKAVVTEAKILQTHMNRLGFNAGVVDGIIGPLTDGAIKRMQKYLGTFQDGMVGPITRGLINNSCGVDGLKKS